MPQATPQDMPETPTDQTDKPLPAQNQGQATQLVTQIHDGLMQLMQLLSKSQAGTPEDQQALQGLIQGFESFVETNLAQGAGQNPQKQQASPQGPVNMETGTAQVQPAY